MIDDLAGSGLKAAVIMGRILPIYSDVQHSLAAPAATATRLLPELVRNIASAPPTPLGYSRAVRPDASRRKSPADRRVVATARMRRACPVPCLRGSAAAGCGHWAEYRMGRGRFSAYLTGGRREFTGLGAYRVAAASARQPGEGRQGRRQCR